MKKIGRRSFLGFAAAVVTGGKGAVVEAAKHAGIMTMGTAAAEAAADTAIYGVGIPNGGTDGYIETLKKRLSLIRRLMNSTPPWKEMEWRSRAAAEARVLDLDIASMRSVSLDAKYRMQRERAYARIKNEEEIRVDGYLQSELFNREHGFYL